jgi:thiol-disulfide isomerase/thioredoxin
MNSLHLALLSILGVTGQSASAPDVKPLLAQIQRVQLQAASDRRNGKLVDKTDLDSQLSRIALDGLVGVDVSKIADESTLDWIPVFKLANRTDDAAALACRAATFYSVQAWRAQQEELGFLVDQGRGEEAVNVLRYAVANEVPMLGQMAEFVHSTMTAKFLATNPKVLFEAYDALLCRMDPSKLTSKIDRQWADFCYVSVMSQRCDLLYAVGRKSEALAGLAILRARFSASQSKNAYGGTPLMAIDRMQESWGMARSAAKEIPAQRTIGKYDGLSKLRGKVVVLDFFAHWCVPCKRAFPELRDFYNRYHPQGFELVGVTSFYGYYGGERDLSADQEFARMERFVREMNVTWPVAFDKTKSYEKTYGVSAIPQLVIIDRRGIVRMVQVGYEPAKKDAIDAEIVKLLAEKA